MKRPTDTTKAQISEKFGEPYEPCYLARRLEQIAVSIFYDLNADLKLTPIQYAALNAIRDYPGYEQRVIARVIAVDRSTINGVTARLSEAGLVVREKAGRNISLTLTPNGKKLLKGVTNNDIKHRKRFLSPLTENQQEQFLTLLRKVVWGNNSSSRAPMEKPAPRK